MSNLKWRIIMKKILLTIFMITIAAFAARDRCFEKDSSGLVINSGDWPRCFHECANERCYSNCQGRTRACFWGMEKSGDEFLAEWYKSNSINSYKKDFCVQLAVTTDSVFQRDNPLSVSESPNIVIATVLFWNKYRDFLTFCTRYDISSNKWYEHFNEYYGDGDGYAKDYANALFGNINALHSYKQWSPKRQFWSFLLSNDRDGEYGRGFDGKGYFYKLSDELNNEYKRIKEVQERSEKSMGAFWGGSINQNFVSNRTENISLTEYLNYLNEIKDPLSSFSSKWKPLIEREIQIHGQIPDKCFALLKYFGRGEIKKGIEPIKKTCNEKVFSKDVYKVFLDSLEKNYWDNASIRGLYGYYLKNFPQGKYTADAEDGLNKNKMPVSEIIKKAKAEYESGHSLSLAIDYLSEYRENYSARSDISLNAVLDKYVSIKDSVERLCEKLKSSRSYDDEYKTMSRCSFVSGEDSYIVEMDSLMKLPRKNGNMTCMYPLYSSDDIFSIIVSELVIKDKKIKEGKETGINPHNMDIVYRKFINDGTSSGFFIYGNIYKVLFDKNGYHIEFLDGTDSKLKPSVVRDIIYLLNGNKNSAKYLECMPIISISDFDVGPSCRDEKEKYEARLQNGRIKSVSIKTNDETVYIPLNNWGKIDGVVKYWNSDIGNVEITVNATMPKGFDEKGRSKVSKVNIKGCSFNPPRKITGYKKTKYGKNPIYEKYSAKCESVASETGMSILLDSVKSYRYRDGEFMPKFLLLYLDWNNVD